MFAGAWLCLSGYSTATHQEPEGIFSVGNPPLRGDRGSGDAQAAYAAAAMATGMRLKASTLLTAALAERKAATKWLAVFGSLAW